MSLIHTKALDRASKLRAQMESEHTLGNQEAAHAFAAAMSRLMLEHELNDADVEAHRLAGTRPVEEPIIERIVDLGRLGIDRTSKRNASLETLTGIVGRAHLCKILIRPGSNTVWLVGTASHVEVAEYMLVVLWRALRRLAAQGRHKAKREGQDVRGYAVSFKEGFTNTLQWRYVEERNQVVVEDNARVAAQHVEERAACEAAGMPYQEELCSAALIRLNTAVARTQAYIDSRYGCKPSARSLGGSYGSNNRGRTDGHTAATSLSLRANGLATGTTRASLSA